MKTVETFLRRARGAVSEADVAAGTGLDIGSVKATLYQLMRAYRSTLAVQEDGTLVYDFGPSLVPLGRATWGQRLTEVGRLLWRGFSFVYKASLAVVLVAYALAFVVLLIAAAVAASSSSDSDGPGEAAFDLVGAIFRGIFEFMTHTAVVYGDVDRHGYAHGHYEPRSPVLPRREPKPHDKGFVASVYDFVLGPARVEPGPRAQHQEVAAFVRKHGGVLTVRDVQALSGMPREEAEAFFARFVAEQDGVASISEQGALYATFEELMRSESRGQDAPVILYWDEYEAPFELTGNTVGKNVLVGFLALFNLFGSFAVLNGALGTAVGSAVTLGLGVVPLVIFSLFFLIPLLRAPGIWWRNRKQHQNNIRKRLFRVLFDARDEKVGRSEVVERANRIAVTEERLRVADIEGLLDETLRDLGDEQELDPRGELVTDMTRMRIEAQATEEQALEERDQDERRVVYRTDR